MALTTCLGGDQVSQILFRLPQFYSISGTLTSVNNLAKVLSEQGKYETAEEIHR